MLSADFVFSVIFVILVPLAIICSACVVADTILAFIKHREERCWNCRNELLRNELESDPEDEPENESSEFVQNDQNNC